MAFYTTQVRSICESLADYEENGAYNIHDIIKKAKPKIFDFNYPYFTAEQKSQLETNILKHYYFEEIGLETYNQWKVKLDIRLNEIMPKYVKMYELISRDFNPFNNVDYTRTRDIDGHNASNTSNNTNTQTNGSVTDTSNNLHWDKFNDTPQGAVTGIESDTYLSNARKVTDSGNNTSVDNTNTASTSTGATNGSNNENLVEHVVGKYGGKSYTELMLEYYSNEFYNIDLMIIKDLQDLFMGLWR